MQRVLSFADLVVIAAAAIGPAFSLATTFGPMVGAAGERTPLALVVVAAIMACVAVGYRSVGARYPDAGSSYTWIRAAFGASAGAYGAWVLLAANVFAILATAVPAGAYTLELLAPGLAASPLALAMVGALWVAVTSVVLVSGMRPAAKLTLGLLVAEMAVLAAAAAAAWLHPPAAAAAVSHAPPSAGAFVGALVIGIWMLDGWEVSASTAEEADGPSDAAGRGGLAGLVVTTAILLACMAGFLRVGTLDGFAAHEADAMAYVGMQLGGGLWSRIITVTVLVSLAASLQTTLIYLTRSMFAMGRDGVLPAAFGRLDRRDQPALAIGVLAAIGIAFMLAVGLSPTVKAAFDFILNGTSFFLGVLFLLSTVSALRLLAADGAGRRRDLAVPAIGGVALAGVLAGSFLHSDGPTRLLIAGVTLAGLPLALWRGRGARAEAPLTVSSKVRGRRFWT